MFGNNGSTSDGWMDALVERRQRLKQLDETRTIRDKYHTEMMDLIGQFNSLREEYANTRRTLDMIAAERDEAYQIMRENESRMGLSREEIRERISEKRNQAREAFDTSIQD